MILCQPPLSSTSLWDGGWARGGLDLDHKGFTAPVWERSSQWLRSRHLAPTSH